MGVVTFIEDVYPYCKGDVVKLEADQLKAVDESAARKGVEGKAYVTGVKEVGDEAVEDGTIPEVLRAVSNPLIPEYPQVDENREPVLEQLTRAESDAKTRQNLTADPADVNARVEEAKAEPAVVNNTKLSDVAPGVEEPAEEPKAKLSVNKTTAKK